MSALWSFSKTCGWEKLFFPGAFSRLSLFQKRAGSLKGHRQWVGRNESWAIKDESPSGLHFLLKRLETRRGSAPSLSLSKSSNPNRSPGSLKWFFCSLPASGLRGGKLRSRPWVWERLLTKMPSVAGSLLLISAAWEITWSPSGVLEVSPSLAEPSSSPENPPLISAWFNFLLLFSTSFLIQADLHLPPQHCSLPTASFWAGLCWGFFEIFPLVLSFPDIPGMAARWDVQPGDLGPAKPSANFQAFKLGKCRITKSLGLRKKKI